MRCMIMSLVLLLANPTAKADNYQDVIFYNDSLNTEYSSCFYHLLNLFSSAIGHGLVVNGSRTGLGNKNPTGKQMAAAGLYFQLLNIVSLADQEMVRQLYHQDNGCLPEHIVLQTGAYASEVIARADANESEFVDKTNRAFDLLFPGISLIQLHALSANQLAANAGDIAPALRQRSAKQGIDYKTRQISRINHDNRSIELIERLQSLLFAYTPLTSRLQLNLPAQPQTGGFNASILLPAFHRFEATDFEDPETWFLQKGMPLTELPIPIRIAVVNVTHLAYLAHADLSQNQVIQVDIAKHFDQPNKLSTTFTFGRLGDADSSDALSVDSSFYEDALVLRVNLDVPPSPNDPRWLRSVKSQVARLTNAFTIDARIHRLTLDFSRADTGTTGSGRFQDAILRPRFSQQGSQISFRLQKDTNLQYERNNLVKLGFQCAQGHQARWHCERNYTTWKGLFSSSLGSFVRLAVNSNIGNIEQAIDEELSEVLDILIDKISKTSNTISDRLDSALAE